MADITFIIPSLGRPTLVRTLQSLKNLNVQNWEAIVVFDGIEPTVESDDSRIKIIKIDKIGKINYAGEVRNAGIKNAKTEWIGFVDDDDVLTPDYLDKFYQEIQMEKTVDVVIFRMKMDNVIMPKSLCKFVKNEVGISFCLKISLFTQENFWFVPSRTEDYDLLHKLRSIEKKIKISEYVTYIVRPITDLM